MTATDKNRLTMGAIEEKLNQNEKEHSDIKINNEREHRDIMEELAGFREDIKHLSLEVAKLPQTILKLSDERYASKTAERAIYGLIGAACLALVYGLVELIKNNYVVV